MSPTRFWPATAGRDFVGRLETGSDLAGEVIIRELGDVSLIRLHDEQTGLALW